MRRAAVPEPITAVTAVAGAWLPHRLAAVEGRLGELVAGHGRTLGGDAAGTLDAGGKRMRPLLVLLCAGPESGPEAVRAATAIELVHMATLVHDDVLDAAPLRRGIPTVVASSGRERAVATGDLLFSRAFGELALADDQQHQVSSLARAAVALAQGELAQRRDAFDTTITAERYLYRCRLKTASLFECACEIGRDPGDPGIEPLREFGRAIGIAFQLLDDVLDIVGPVERTGKARGTDLLDGTVTLPFILAAEHDPGILKVDPHDLDAADAERLCDRIVATGATGTVREDARTRIEKAKQGLSGSGLGSEMEALLEQVADGVVERYS